MVDDGRPDVADYNEELGALQSPTWFNMPWLYAECYLYRSGSLLLAYKFRADSEKVDA